MNTETAQGQRFQNISADGNSRQHNGNVYAEVYNNVVSSSTQRERSFFNNLSQEERDQALLQAATEGQARRLMLLIHADANLDFKDENGCMALHRATLSGHRDCIEPLIYHGADINATCRENGASGRNALYFAARSGDYSLVEFLIGQRANPDPETCSPLFTAFLHKHRDVVELLLKKGVTLDGAFLASCNVGSLSVAKKLLDKGANVAATTKSDGRTALMLAAFVGCEPLVVLLLDAGADVHTTTSRGMSPLKAAVSKGHERITKILLSRGALVNRENKKENPILRFAARQGNGSMVKILLDNGATSDLVNENGLTALMEAASEGHDSVVKLMVANGASVDIKSPRGRTALALAAFTGQKQIVKTLLDMGADINTKDNQGSTPLILAADRGHVEVVRLLIDKGADITLKDKWGGTAYATAHRKGHIDVRNLLFTRELEMLRLDWLELVGPKP